MSEYELARQENIRANQLLLASLGIDPVQTKPAPTPKAEPDGKPKNRRPARSKPYERARAVPIRQSARISALDAPIYSDHLSIAASMDDKQGSIRRVYSDSPPAVRKAIRQLPRAPSPYVEDDVDYSIVAPQPARDDDGTFRFEAGYEGFTPNMAPWEMLREGSFGGSYWR
ncbi:hypothetical protein [Phaffia rhodozyma]|uniref:Uncharacterized protein n=1 Tax=Phaffia rhodozyma TaxID=264483 RepID=A0A0F7SQ65_PHARH|nr:hypothetical protein [Phaffia rhodozyma]